MKSNKNIDEWVASIDGKTTFAGVIIDHFDEMCKDYGWNADSTKKDYLREYTRQIIPFIKNHDARTLDEYTYSDYQAIIDAIKADTEKSESRLLHFIHLIGAVAKMAEKKYNYPNVLWGTAFELPETLEVKEKIQELVTLKKSFSPKQELSLYHVLSTSKEMSGERFGVYLMLVFGVRNGEAAAITFGDILESYTETNFHALFVYKTIESKEHRLVSSGKTKNADRILPIPEPAYRFLLERKQYVAEKTGKSLREIDRYPVACVGADYKRSCRPEQIAQAARVVFKEIGLKPQVLSYLDYEILQGENTVVVREKDPTSYLMRRNFATQMVIIGMTESEIQFLLGHDITDAYETRNEMAGFELLKQMDRKMAERAIFYMGDPQIELSNLEYCREYDFPDCASVGVNIAVTPGDLVTLNVESAEPKGSPIIRIKKKGGIKIEKVHYVKQGKFKEDRTVNILNKYHEVYGKYSKE